MPSEGALAVVAPGVAQLDGLPMRRGAVGGRPLLLAPLQRLGVSEALGRDERFQRGQPVVVVAGAVAGIVPVSGWARG